MKATEYLLPTLREVPTEAEIPSHQLLLRAGFIRKLSAGVYTYLPLGWRVIRKIEQALRDEMDVIAGLEMRMPTLHPRELMEETGRWNVPVVFKLSDNSTALGFTHEEVVTDIARREVRSWRDLPLLVYQMQTKFRNEPRPRGGVIRTREFIMFDAYSFDADETAMDVSYRKFWTAYENTFRRCGLQPVIAEADAGDIGGSANHEFLVLSSNGEDTVLLCPACNWAANAEACAIAPPENDAEQTAHSRKPLEMVSTPGARTVEEVASFLGTGPENLVKTLLYVADDSTVAALVRGDRELNEIKLARYLGVKNLHLADAATVERITNAPVGFAGPIGLNGTRLIADHEIRPMRNFIAGANQADAHYVHVNRERDFTPTEYADIRTAVAGDPCPRCDGTLEERRGIEVGHIFQLGTKYSVAMNATFTSEDGQAHPLQMGCYGIGIPRTMAAAVETGHDDNGIIWHPDIAPFAVVIVVANPKDAGALAAGQELHNQLTAHGVDVLLDDRDERAGVKFKDADLIGYPVRVVVGKGLANGVLEARPRRDAAASREIPVAEAADTVIELLAQLRGA